MADLSFNPYTAAIGMLALATPIPPNTGDGCNVIYPRDSRSLDDLPTYPPPPFTPSPPTTAPPGTPFGGLLGGGGTWAVDASDMLRFSIWVTGGPKEVAFNGRLVRDNGVLSRWSHRVTGNSATVPATKIVAAGSGLISQVSAISTSGVGAATIDVLAELGHEEGGVFVTEAILLQGRLTDQGIASPTVSTGGGGGGSACEISGADISVTTGGNTATVDIPAPPTGQFTRIIAVLFDLDTLACLTDTQYNVIFVGDTLTGWQTYTVPYVTKGLAQAGVVAGYGAATGAYGGELWRMQIPVGFALPEATHVIIQAWDGSTDAIISAGYVSYQYTTCCC